MDSFEGLDNDDNAGTIGGAADQRRDGGRRDAPQHRLEVRVLQILLVVAECTRGVRALLLTVGTRRCWQWIPCDQDKPDCLLDLQYGETGKAQSAPVKLAEHLTMDPIRDVGAVMDAGS